MDRAILSGNEAIARGAYEAGVKVASRLSRHPLHRNSRKRYQLQGNRRLLGAQREGCPRSRHRRLLWRRSRSGRHEARRRQRRRRPALHPLLHRGARRSGAGHGRRSGDALLAERAGQPQLRQVRQGADAGALRFPGVQGFHPPRLRDLRAVRHPGHAAHHYPHLPQQVDRDRSASG